MKETDVDHQTSNVEATVVPAVPLAPSDCQNAPPSENAKATMVESPQGYC